jgi:sugar phosphate isomerase/epimerase
LEVVTLMLRTDALSLAAAPLTSYGSSLDSAQVRAMIDAAADAGFSGMSIDVAHHDWAVADGMASDEFFDYHRRRGLSIPAAEVILEWATGDREAVAQANAHILDVTARAGAASVIAATLEPAVPSLRDVAGRLAGLCDLAAERGVAISYEFLPPTAVPDLATAARLLEAVDRENFGLVLDTWHWFLQSGGPDLDTLREIPPARIHILQLNDAPAAIGDDWVHATMTARLLPGDGVIDIPELLGALDAMCSPTTSDRSAWPTARADSSPPADRSCLGSRPPGRRSPARAEPAPPSASGPASGDQQVRRPLEQLADPCQQPGRIGPVEDPVVT